MSTGEYKNIPGPGTYSSNISKFYKSGKFGNDQRIK